MRFLKLFQLAVVFLIAAALLGGISAPSAGADSKATVIQLTSTVVDVTDPDYDASGTATLSNLRTTWYRNGVSYSAKVRVTCEGLTPGAMYEVRTNVFDFVNLRLVTWDFRASGKGTGGAGGSVEWPGSQSLGVAVFRVDDTPAGTDYTQVLDGYPIS